ncbi:patatin-like phospholipase family protein [Kribbella sp. NPDC051620]|uniref:patatin-like phospholipase family protein n=1 Tax=Kribbella sp. NPDC051620 TaxID=3364120 RepID=UPI0037A1075F
MTEPSPSGGTADAEGSSLRDCDLIMKGGISSGIVYPRAVSELAKTYRLRRIGGASAGAIAAAFAAAAQYGGADGFAKLDKIPESLGTGLADLFQPEDAMRPAHSIVTGWLEPAWSIGRKVRASVSVIIRRSRWTFMLVALLLLVPGFAVAVTSRGAPQDLGDWLGLALATMVWLPTALVVATVAAAVELGAAGEPERAGRQRDA